ncbi:MAG: Uma2 family endonuclease [Spirochaetes bacterium]|nr:MAG: Uma2 family endonuclease [Spirochaetota bacterium]
MVTGKKVKYTYKDYAKLPEGAPYQLIGGDLVKSPSPVPYHQGLAGRFHLLFAELEKKGKGKVFFSPIDVYLGETETYQPDLIFICSDRLHIIGDKKIEGPPDIVVEILSPSNAYYDLRHKKDVYEHTGVKEYWVVDPPEKRVEVYVNSANGFTISARADEKGTVASVLFPEIVVSLEELFRE